jgi:phosphate transport system permease protein
MTAIAPAATGLQSNLAKRRFKNNTATVLVWLSFGIALIPLVWLLWTVLSRGLSAVVRPEWWTSDQRNVQSSSWQEQGGGALHAIIGTAEQVALCSLISVPIGVLAAVYLVEYGRGWFRSAVTFMVDILTGVPSIVAALFIYGVFIIEFNMDFAGVWASLALVLLMIPVIVRTTEEMLKLVPNELREASYALGVPKWKTIAKIVLPTAFSGIMTGIVLGIARVAGETAPLLILVHYNWSENTDLFSGDQASLPFAIYSLKDIATNNRSLVGQPVHNYGAERMWGAALTLILFVMLLNLIARLIARRSKIAN